MEWSKSRKQLRPNTGIFTSCKICKGTFDNALFKWQNGKRVGLVCIECDLKKKRSLYKTDETYRNDAIYRARIQEPNKEVSSQWRINNQEKVKARRISYHIENRDSINMKTLEWYRNNKEYAKSNMRVYQEKNKESLAEYRKTYYQENKELFLINSREWRKNNLGLVSSYYRAYNLAKNKRMPKWANVEDIRKFYADRPIGYEVDHIIPLFGKLVSGLHVLENLQYLTASENSIKSNKFNIEEFNK